MHLRGRSFGRLNAAMQTTLTSDSDLATNSMVTSEGALSGEVTVRVESTVSATAEVGGETYTGMTGPRLMYQLVVAPVSRP